MDRLVIYRLVVIPSEREVSKISRCARNDA